MRAFTFFSAASARAVAALISSDAASAPLLTAAASMDAMSVCDELPPFLPPMDAVSERTLAISSSTADLFFTSDSSRRRSFVSVVAASSSA